MNLAKAFPCRVVLNLRRRADRLDAVLKRMSAAGVDAEVMEAVDAENVLGPGRFKSVGYRAHQLSLLKILSIAKARAEAAVLIIEDDARFAADFAASVAALLLPKDWQMFYFGCLHLKTPAVVSPGIVRSAKALDTHCFAIRNSAFNRAIEALHGEGRTELYTDMLLAELHAELPVYAAFPNLAWQGDDASDITPGRPCNYDAEGRQVFCSEAMANL